MARVNAHRREYMREYMRNYRTHYNSNEYMKEYYSDPEHREHLNKYKREYMRKNYIGTVVGGERVVLRVQDKRLRPEVCELCEDPSRNLLSYHHWDDEDFSKGLWLCHNCHMFAEIVDKSIRESMFESVERYLYMKRQVEKEFRTMEA